jgi:dihydrofolate reductase
MPELLVDFITSLDGCGAAEGWPGWWGLQGPEYLAWANTQLVSGDPVEAVREMKYDEGSSSMRTMGSLTLCRSLLKAGLVDRFRVVVFPVITGSTGSDRIYDGYPDVALDMVSSRTFDGRIQLLEYVPTVLAAPPGTNNGDA